jgi:hypothetical protein
MLKLGLQRQIPPVQSDTGERLSRDFKQFFGIEWLRQVGVKRKRERPHLLNCPLTTACFVDVRLPVA